MTHMIQGLHEHIKSATFWNRLAEQYHQHNHNLYLVFNALAITIACLQVKDEVYVNVF